MKAVTEAGATFGRLTALQFAHKQRGEIHWMFRCRCGKEKPIRASRVVSGAVVSCGCYGMERAIAASRIHGGTKNGKATTEYCIWRSMKRRCLKPACPSYPRYGGRGISVCEEWQRSFKAFLEHVGMRPTPKHSLDRINNDGNYEPGNVRWATASEQRQNSRQKTNRIHFQGRVQCLAEWAREIGLSENALRLRIRRWGVDRAIASPIQFNRRTRCAK